MNLRKIFLLLFSFLCVLALTIGCSDDKKNPVSDNGGEDSGDFFFPFNTPNTWTYRATVTERNNADLTLTRSYELDVEWLITSLVVTPSVETFGMKCISTIVSEPDSGYTLETNAFYAVEGDTLKSVYREGSKPLGHNFPQTRLLESAVAHESGAEYQSWELNVLLYPFELGKAWPLSRSGTDLGMKRVLSFKDVETPAGTYKAYKVVRTFPGYEFATWFAEVGVVKKTIIGWHDTETDEDGVPLVMFEMEMELVDYKLKK